MRNPAATAPTPSTLIHPRHRRPRRRPIVNHQQPGLAPWKETETVTDVSSTDHTEGGRAPGRPSPALNIDLSDPDAIARTAHEPRISAQGSAQESRLR
jgi:hypothetical protein